MKKNQIMRRPLGVEKYEVVARVTGSVKPVTDPLLLAGAEEDGVYETKVQEVNASEPVRWVVEASEEPGTTVGFEGGDPKVDMKVRPNPSSSHKIFTTTASRQKIKEIINRPEYAPLKKQLYSGSTVVDHIAAYAFDYLVYGNATNGRKAIDMMEDVYERGYRLIKFNGRGTGIVAIVMSWCRDLMSSSERTKWRNRFHSDIFNYDTGDSPFAERSGGSVLKNSIDDLFEGDRYVESMVSGHNGSHVNNALYWGIALENDDARVYNQCADFLIKKMFPDQEPLVKGYHHQGSQYGFFRAAGHCLSAYALRAIAEENGLSAKFPLSRRYGLGSAINRIYHETPDTWAFHAGDLYHKLIAKELDQEHFFKGMVCSLWAGNAHFQSWHLRGLSGNSLGGGSGERPPGLAAILFCLIALEGAPALKDHTELPRTYVSDSPCVAAFVKESHNRGRNFDSFHSHYLAGGIQFNNHKHLDDMSWQAYCGGKIIQNHDHYSGKLFNAVQRRGYTSNGISKSTLLLFDPSQPVDYFGAGTGSPMPRTGQQGMDNEDTLVNQPRQRAAQLLNSEFNYEKLIAKGHGPKHVQVQSDFVDAFHAYKANRVDRHYVSILSKNAKARGIVIIRDIIDLKLSRVKPIWTHYTKQAPTNISGDNFTLSRRGSNGMGSSFTADMKGWVFGESVKFPIVQLPANDKSFPRERDGNLVRNQSVIDLEPMPSYSDKEGHPGYCVEVQMKNYDKTRYNTLMVYQFASAGEEMPRPVYNDQGSVIILQVADYTVVFDKQGVNRSGYTFTHAGGPILLLNLTAGRKQVGPVARDVVNKEHEIWLDNLAPGTYTIE